MLEHTGRKSGLARYVVLEVVSRAAPGSYIVASGLGSHSQWFINVQANPHVRLFIASRRPAPATAHVLTPAETQTAMTAYRVAHPKAWSALKPVLTATLGTALDDSGSDLPMVRFDLDA
ncbi:deazaflavin-dependent oxidoreductase (nitroreductase family) [Cryobacterium psychrophilum]|nr:deazaflavin-dependent oxidoreductase (nitroreductase family) [Cryobacterium psychrophilum]